MNRQLHVTISKAGSGQDYVEIAQGDWMVGREPQLTGEPIPPEVLKGFEAQVCLAPGNSGVVTHDRGGIRYALEYQVVQEV